MRFDVRTPCSIHYNCCRVLNAIRYWVEHHYYDFQEDASLKDDLMAFLRKIKNNNLKKWIESIHRTLQRQVGVIKCTFICCIVFCKIARSRVIV